MNSTVKRSIFGLIFLAVMLGGLLVHEFLYILLLAFITYVMLDEFYKLTMGDSCKYIQTVARILGVIIFLQAESFFVGGRSGSLLLYTVVFAVFILMIASILQKDHSDFLKTGYLYAGYVYILLPLCLFNMAAVKDGAFSGLLLVALFCIIWASDVGAYCLGMLLGQKVWPAKMCPRISPKKSWAGFIGGLLFACLAGAILHWTGLMAFPMVHCLVLATLMHVAGVFGDLFESLWKRAAGVKDSGNVIPGHGGLMDRFDSALFAIPTACIYLAIIGL